VDVRSSAALDAIRRHARPRDAGPYGPGKPYSFFRDLAVVGEALSAADALKNAGQRFEGKLRDRGGAHPIHGTLDEASNRLAEAEKRAVSAVGWDFLSDEGSLGQGYVGGLFSVPARTKATLASRLPTEELPKDITVRIPRFTSGATVGYQTENQAGSNTDPVSGAYKTGVATITGYVDGALQDLEQSPGDIVDKAIAQDLGNAWGAMLEQEVLNGDGVQAGNVAHLLGLLNIAGITTTTYTDGTPTPAEFLAYVGACYASTATAYGGPIDTIVLAPRRRSWVDTKIGIPFRWPAQVLESAGVPTNLGAGTEDAALFLALDETTLLTSDVRFDVLTEVLSGTLSVRFRAYAYVALLGGRQPASIGKLVGTGCAAPVF
ncbi:MAG: hypothetical protein QOG85_158, partial [Gaiellaceae bacterium]|nr:hypothetical protein [Gaiellaceae bacterium]